MKLIIDIPEEAYKQIMEFGFLENTHGKMCYKAIKNGTPIPDNATNGDVFKAVFPKGADLLFGVNWWYKPYQKGGKDAESD